ncbi:MAG: hypothetical protein K9N46_03740 [Candidatus Marinimicrobia bacterium]|nr:hypothetical protein [Candidatus Neomarinimicrobiota bacterium]MCF7829674.1 hypothetical protein [Candidatus Neomarinimicrobiota bacterium]MCF7879834.1 hypothetical protein [Candidatus Neomarinimicrobiota bacterium]
MKRLIPLLSLIFISSLVFAGGIVTNTNQSAEFIRMLNRNASTDIDAVYYNPAAVAGFSEGLYFYASNQSVFQTRTVTSANSTFNENTFEGKTTAPVFPNIYVAYNMGGLAVSGGIMPIGGGGSAEYPDGLPAFEYTLANLARGIPASSLDQQLSPYGTINGYSLEAKFTGSSIYLGGQGNVSYQVLDYLSVAAGIRYVYASNTYEGYLRDLTLYTSQNPNGSPPGTIAAAQAGALLADKEVDAARTGSGIAGILSAQFRPIDNANISFRYETITKLEMTNDTETDDVGLFPDGAKVQSDMPALIAVGVGYQVNSKLHTEASFTYYLNSGVDWEGDEQYVNNGFEAGLGVEYQVNDAITASIGGLTSQSGATESYQSDLSYSLNSTSLGLGLEYALSEVIALSVGYSKTFYEDGQNDKSGNFAETYGKTSDVIALGFGYDL